MTYSLPELPYDYAALEPHISARIMELHHSKHHKAYVDGANNALAQMAEARESGNFANINRLEKDLAFHLGGHVNHSIFWTNLAPGAGGTPDSAAGRISPARVLWLVRRFQGPFPGRVSGHPGIRVGSALLGPHRIAARYPAVV